MTDYIVSARKYRPGSFRAVVGQKNLTATLKNAIDTKRLAQAYLFCGPRGVGKTSCARIFAKTINCLHPTADGEACGECDSCKAIEQGNSFNIIELDAASNNSVEDIRKISDEVNIPPQVGDYKVFIIDEVHMLTSNAFNAFLKTLEEPPKNVIFILATTEKHKVIPTILSRCQIYDFKRITTPDIVDHLAYVASQEGIEATAEALNAIARKADGAMRDALSMFDQIAASSMGNVTYQSALANLNMLDYDYYFSMIEAFRAGSVGSALLIFNEIREKGFDPLFFINGLASHVRDLMVAADPKTAKLLEVADEVKPKYTAQAQSLPLDWYYTAIRLINDCDYSYRTATNKQLLVELLLIRLCQLLNPPVPPYDRVDSEPPIQMPSKVEATPVVKPATPSSGPSGKAVPESKPTEPKAESAPEAAAPAGSPAQPSLAPKPVAAPKARKTSSKSIRLTDLEANYDEKKESEGEKRMEINPEALVRAWKEFIDNNADKPILVAAMKGSEPRQTGKEEFRVEVVHPAQKQAFESNMTKLLAFLREKLSNDFISIEVIIAENEDIAKPMPPKDLFRDMLEKNASLANLMQGIEPEII